VLLRQRPGDLHCRRLLRERPARRGASGAQVCRLLLCCMVLMACGGWSECMREALASRHDDQEQQQQQRRRVKTPALPLNLTSACTAARAACCALSTISGMAAPAGRPPEACGSSHFRFL
jgi:hypothetical protein